MCYDGARYHGWQEQAGVPTVQAALETAVASFCGEHQHPRVVAAGRTDSGVHATGQTIQFDIRGDYDAKSVVCGVNDHLRRRGHADIALTYARRMYRDISAMPERERFHVRTSAVLRIYEYTILQRLAPSPWSASRCWHVRQGLDTQLLASEAQSLVGHHDFTSFRGRYCQARSPVKTMNRVSVGILPGFAIESPYSAFASAGQTTAHTDEAACPTGWSLDGDARGVGIVLRFEARSFLHHQVRNMVGSLIDVASGAHGWGAGSMAELLAACDRTQAGIMAPAQGLCLVKVVYDNEFLDADSKA